MTVHTDTRADAPFTRDQRPAHPPPLPECSAGVRHCSTHPPKVFLDGGRGDLVPLQRLADQGPEPGALWKTDLGSHAGNLKKNSRARHVSESQHATPSGPTPPTSRECRPRSARYSVAAGDLMYRPETTPSALSVGILPLRQTTGS